MGPQVPVQGLIRLYKWPVTLIQSDYISDSNTNTERLTLIQRDYEHRDQDRPTGLITNTYRKLNDLTRHLKFIIRSVTGQRQSIFNRKKKPNNDDDDDVLPYNLVNSDDVV